MTKGTTPGAANACTDAPNVAQWPGSPDTTVIDTSAMFLVDSSGLDFAMEGDQGILWAIDNGTGTLWKLNASADGTVTFADGWATGKRVRFIKDAANPSAAGPDSEGVTMAGDGFIYVAAERDNSNKGVNHNVILKVDPNEAGPDLVAKQEWNITSSLPQVSANTGIEAVQWVADANLTGKLWDATKKAPYNPADYPLHGDGLFFVAVEDNGGVYAYALNRRHDDPGRHIQPPLGGVMALDWDEEFNVLWAMCDDGCAGTGVQIVLNGTDTPDIAAFQRPANLPNTNNEGFATSTLCVAGNRPVWWFTDGVATGSLRSGTLPCEYVAPEPVDTTPPVLGSVSVAGTVGTPLSVTVKATDASLPLVFSATGLPAGVTINAVTGVISGTPTAAGTFEAEVVVADAKGNATVTSVTLVIAAKATTPTSPPVVKPYQYVRTAPYTMPGKHNLNGRQWVTTCEKYSQTERCRTEIWATVVTFKDGKYQVGTGWAFNNLTYLPYMYRSQWKGNPLAEAGTFSSAGAQWRTECDTAATGRNGCRTYRQTTVYTATPAAGGGYTFRTEDKWVFNNIVMFRSTGS